MSVGLWSDTLSGLVAPTRLVPVVVLAGVFLSAQAWSTGAPPWSGLVAVLGFWMLGPFSWRWWRPATPDRVAYAPAGLLVLGAVTAPSLGLLLLAAWDHGRGSFFTNGINGVVVGALYAVGAWGLARDLDQTAFALAEEKRRQHAEQLTAHARLLALNAHLDPHFLFNTLNAVAAWCREDAGVAEAALLRLAEVLREIQSAVGQTRWPLARELRLVHQVAQLWEVRDPGRFGLDWEVELETGRLGPEVPPLVFLPLIENAYTHGPGRGFPGRVGIRCAPVPGRLLVEFQNPGSYLGRRDGGEGLSMVERRLAQIGGQLEIQQARPGWVRVRVSLPC